MPELGDFDGRALMAALDDRRAARHIDWNRLAVELHEQSSDLNARLAGPCLCQGALVRTYRRGTMSCQYALPILRWLERAPEDFLTGPVRDVGDVRLPQAGPDRRLRFDLPRLHATADARRRELGMTWVRVADELGCTSSRVTNLRTARLADMGLTMRVTQWVGRPAAAFVDAVPW